LPVARKRHSPASDVDDDYRNYGQETLIMLALVAAVIFAIAFIIRAAGISTDAVFAPASLVIVGLVLLALHLAGVGASWRYHR
jgi:hypothetical protein